jgi:hypothetical protein
MAGEVQRIETIDFGGNPVQRRRTIYMGGF